MKICIEYLGKTNYVEVNNFAMGKPLIIENMVFVLNPNNNHYVLDTAYQDITVEAHGLPVLQINDKCVGIDKIQSSDFTLADIARSLANTCRFAGKTKGHYSTAEHSVHLYRYMTRLGHSRYDRKCALLHDAHEFIIGDVIGPIKSSVGKRFKAVDDAAWNVIRKKFDINSMTTYIKDFDMRIMFNEKRDALDHDIDWGWKMQPLGGIVIRMWERDQAFTEFMTCAEEIGLVDKFGADIVHE